MKRKHGKRNRAYKEYSILEEEIEHTYREYTRIINGDRI